MKRNGLIIILIGFLTITGCTKSPTEMRTLNEALLKAVSIGDVSAVKSILKKGAYANPQDSAGNTAVMVAAKAGNMEILEILLDKKY